MEVTVSAEQTEIEKTLAEEVEVPQGFTKTIGPNKWEFGEATEGFRVDLISEDVKIEIHIIAVTDDWNKEDLVTWDGIDSFKTANGWKTFWSRGVDCGSFSGAWKKDDINAQVGDLLTKIRDCQEKSNSEIALPSPFNRFTADADKIAGFKATIASGKQVTLTPGGFGTGYEIGVRRRRRYSQLVTGPEIKNVFGVMTVYYDTLDCD